MSKVLYLGLDPQNFITHKEIIHCPLIQIKPKPFTSQEVTEVFSHLELTSHLIFTSKATVNLFFAYLESAQISLETVLTKVFISIGKVTTATIRKYGDFQVIEAPEATQEGVISLFERLPLSNPFIFYPHSSIARDNLIHYMKNQEIRFIDLPFYDTESVLDLNLTSYLKEVDEVVFTSPSTVDAFFNIVENLPSHLICTCQGPITRIKLQNYLIQ